MAQRVVVNLNDALLWDQSEAAHNLHLIGLSGGYKAEILRWMPLRRRFIIGRLVT